MKLERRSAFGWPATAAGYGPCKNGLVVHYDGANKGLARKSHSACVDYWKWCRRFHMGTRGWADIGYSFGVCPHGYVLEGRGWQRQQAAQPGGNSTWTSCTFMSGPSETPTQAQVNAFRELRAWLRGKGLGSAIKGHRDFISTSCPGSILYRMVRSGALKGAPGEEDDMPSAKEVAEEVWRHNIEASWLPKGEGHDRQWQADTHLGVMHRHVRQAEAQIVALQTTLDKVVDQLGASQPDLDALKAEIREAIEGIRVRLDVPDEEPAQG